MSIEAKKIELAKRLFTIDDEQLLEEIKWILERPNIIDKELSSSIKQGMEQANKADGVSHSVAKAVYKQWL